MKNRTIAACVRAACQAMALGGAIMLTGAQAGEPGSKAVGNTWRSETQLAERAGAGAGRQIDRAPVQPSARNTVSAFKGLPARIRTDACASCQPRPGSDGRPLPRPLGLGAQLRAGSGRLRGRALIDDARRHGNGQHPGAAGLSGCSSLPGSLGWRHGARFHARWWYEQQPGTVGVSHGRSHARPLVVGRWTGSGAWQFRHGGRALVPVRCGRIARRTVA
jgi:hypothetical protein